MIVRRPFGEYDVCSLKTSVTGEKGDDGSGRRNLVYNWIDEALTTLFIDRGT